MRATAVIAFQGQPGAYSEQAARQHFGETAITLPCHTFAEIFSAIKDGQASYGMLPVENSLAGTVIPAYDELMAHDLQVQGEEIARVRHCLLAPPGTILADITRAKSHPQALDQCRDTLRGLGIEPVTAYDTAGAARHLAEAPEAGTAAIASELAAKLYGLDILVRDCQDTPLNYTRFFVLSTGTVPRKDPSKTSIIFTTDHTPGALYTVLGELAGRQINLTKIESRPDRTQPWHYLFYVDFEGHQADDNVAAALDGIRRSTSFLRILGSFTAASVKRET